MSKDSDKPKTPKTAIEMNIDRLLVSFSAPELSVEDFEKFTAELKRMLAGFTVNAVTDAVSKLIDTRRSKAFPTIGDIRQHIVEQLPKSQGGDHVDMSRVFEAEDSKRQRALTILCGLSGKQRRRLLEDTSQLRVFDFIVDHNRAPDADEYRRLMKEGKRVERLLAESDAMPEGSSSVFASITRSAAGAIRHRRAVIAEVLEQSLVASPD